MDIGIIGGVTTMPLFQECVTSSVSHSTVINTLFREFGYEGKSKIDKSNLSANLVSVMQAGAVVGALVAFPCADKWGRKVGLDCTRR